MKNIRLKNNVLVMLASTVLSAPAFAIDFLQTAETVFYSPMPEQRFGMEVELMGLSQQQVLDITRQEVGGEIEVVNKLITRIHNSKMGEKLDIKIEVNETSDDPTIDWSKNSNNVIEIVTDPILESEVALLEKILGKLQSAGAIGTEKSNPISIQVNFDMRINMPVNRKATLLLDIMRNYFNPEHQEQIKEVSNVPESRWPYLRPYSKGFMARVMNPNYRPTAEQLFFDFFYRQTLENHLRHNKVIAWSMPEAEVRQRIEAMNYKVDVQIIKLNQLKIASLLVAWFPNDPFSKVIVDHGWIKAAELIEYRIANNDFRVLNKVRQAIGIFQMSLKLGAIQHDQYMSQKTGLSINEIRKTRVPIKCDRYLKNTF